MDYFTTKLVSNVFYCYLKYSLSSLTSFLVDTSRKRMGGCYFRNSLPFIVPKRY